MLDERFENEKIISFRFNKYVRTQKILKVLLAMFLILFSSSYFFCGTYLVSCVFKSLVIAPGLVEAGIAQSAKHASIITDVLSGKNPEEILDAKQNQIAKKPVDEKADIKKSLNNFNKNFYVENYTIFFNVGLMFFLLNLLFFGIRLKQNWPIVPFRSFSGADAFARAASTERSLPHSRIVLFFAMFGKAFIISGGLMANALCVILQLYKIDSFARKVKPYIVLLALEETAIEPSLLSITLGVDEEEGENILQELVDAGWVIDTYKGYKLLSVYRKIFDPTYIDVTTDDYLVDIADINRSTGESIQQSNVDFYSQNPLD